MATYNGHKNWNHWNVSLWINNDEELYRLSQEGSRYLTKAERVERLYEQLRGQHTPDGAPYSKSAIRAAIE